MGRVGATNLAVLLVAAFTANVSCQDLPFLSEGLYSDREALLALRDAVMEFGDSNVRTWRPTGNPCSPKPWRHITCGGGRVIDINLSNLRIAGFLPTKLRLADKLISLNLAGNRFTGGVPTAWAARTSFPALRVLNLANNELSGTLPNWNRAGAWRSLMAVDLSSNNFFGGLPPSWLGTQRPLRRVQYLDLSSNHLGRANGSVAGDPLPRDQWCRSEAAAGLSAGSGWCPSDGSAPLAGTAASLLSLDLSNNGLTGAIPERWPFMFPALNYLMLDFNSLSKQMDVGGTPTSVPSILPRTWTSDRLQGFPSLSILTLYPGNEYLCSVPAIDGGFNNVNLDTTYQVLDTSSTAYNDGNPRRCPVASTEETSPSSALLVPSTRMEWEYGASGDVADIWGFKLSVWGEGSEGGPWLPLAGWNGVRVRTYTHSDDGFDAGDVADQGLVCTPSPTKCVLTFAASSRGDIAAPVFGGEVGRLRVDVSTITLDGRVSPPTSSPAVDV